MVSLVIGPYPVRCTPVVVPVTRGRVREWEGTYADNLVRLSVNIVPILVMLPVTLVTTAPILPVRPR